MSGFKCDQFDPAVETVDEFIQRLRCQMKEEFHKLRNDSSRQASLLLKCLPTQMITDLQRRIAPKKLYDADYDELELQLREKYSDKKSSIGAAVQFFRHKQEPGQTIEEYAQHVNFLATQCQYDSDVPLDRLIRDVFVSGLHSSAILSSVLESTDKQSFEETVQKAKLVQQLKSDAISIQNTRQHSVHHTEETNDFPQSSESDSLHSVQSKSVPFSYICIRCGTKGKHFHDKCFALDLNCRNCNKKGHIAKMCRSKPNSQQSSRQPARSSTTYNNSNKQCTTCHAHAVSGETAESSSVQRCQMYPDDNTLHSVSSLHHGQRRSADRGLQYTSESITSLHNSSGNVTNNSSNSQSLDNFLM